MVSGVASSPVAAGAAIGAPAGAAIEYAEARPGKKGLSRREINLRGQLASLREQEKLTGSKSGKIDRLKKRLEKAEMLREAEAQKRQARAFATNIEKMAYQLKSNIFNIDWLSHI